MSIIRLIENLGNKTKTRDLVLLRETFRKMHQKGAIGIPDESDQNFGIHLTTGADGVVTPNIGGCIIVLITA